MPEYAGEQAPERVRGAGAPQGLAWSWELDLGALPSSPRGSRCRPCHSGPD